MMETSTRTFLCGDLFTQGGAGETPLTESDILGPSEAFRAPMDYFAHAPGTGAILERLARGEADDARVHARQRVAGRWGGAAPCARQESRCRSAELRCDSAQSCQNQSEGESRNPFHVRNFRHRALVHAC